MCSSAGAWYKTSLICIFSPVFETTKALYLCWTFPDILQLTVSSFQYIVLTIFWGTIGDFSKRPQESVNSSFHALKSFKDFDTSFLFCSNLILAKSLRAVWSLPTFGFWVRLLRFCQRNTFLLIFHFLFGNTLSVPVFLDLHIFPTLFARLLMRETKRHSFANFYPFLRLPWHCIYAGPSHTGSAVCSFSISFYV